jgi:hypothetical protein
MTFCNKFFNMPSLGEAIASTPKKSAAVKGHLASWDNRARVFLHETTHLDYFMNAPGYSPLVDDLQFDWNENGQTVRDWAYGPFSARCCGTTAKAIKLASIHKEMVRHFFILEARS